MASVESEDDTSHHLQLIVQELHAGVSGAHLGQEYHGTVT